MKQQNLVERQKSKVKSHVGARQKSKVESQEPRAKRRKHKVVKWEYVTKPFDVLVHPATVKRVHSQLEPSLTPHYSDRELNLHLRPCVQGVNGDGAGNAM